MWLVGPAALRHVGSSWTRARTHFPCIGRQTFNHCTTREAPLSFLLVSTSSPSSASTPITSVYFSVHSWLCSIAVLKCLPVKSLMPYGDLSALSCWVLGITDTAHHPLLLGVLCSIPSGTHHSPLSFVSTDHFNLTSL